MRRSWTDTAPQAGVTLVELLVAISIVGMIVSLTGLAFFSLRTSGASTLQGELQDARARALRTGRPVAFPAFGAPARPTVLFLPDGRSIGEGADPLTGAPIGSAP